VETYEKLGSFYLGKTVAMDGPGQAPELVLYDSKDLTTHAVIIGMTGSGKTGLGVALLEEALLDKIPVIAIDPKGDITNLALTFPGLQADDLKPWVNPQEALAKGKTVDAYAADEARKWTDGLAQWGQNPERIARLKAAAELTIYTPGSSAGKSVSLLRRFNAPPAVVIDDPDLFSERIETTTSSLMALLDLEADPLSSREHILVANIFSHTWREGQGLDLAGLIQAIQNPPFERVGIMDLDSFYPAKDRFALAMRINNLLAAPGFSAWLEGTPLSIPDLLHTPTGQPRASVFTISHLSDAQRMFFVSMLLNELLGWMRTQSGTTSLRAILYMDEVFGYFPPVSNPPSKTPLLRLLKQARAFGLGVVLATQNPVDLDYRGLSNTGTWLIGRLQTERDQMRVMDGLQGGALGGKMDAGRLKPILAGLESRTFLLHNVHEDGPVVFKSRWALSYLRGPLTRDQIKQLADEGLPIYAECGGLMYMGRELVLDDGTYPMTGVLPLSFGFSRRPQGHGYTVVKVARANPFYEIGQEIRGHEFHYSTLQLLADEPDIMAFEMTRGSGLANGRDGFCRDNVLATYTHIHALGTPQWAPALVKKALMYRASRLKK